MFIGYYQLGDLLPVSVWTLDAAGTPTEPDDVPVLQIYDADGLATYTKILPVVDSANITGYFQYRVNLDQAFSTGYHSLIIHYVISSTSYAIVGQFEVVDGGDDEGQGIAMHFFKQPAADYVLLQTDRGSLKRLRGPTIRGVT
jgi:hypothetical protein